jgi:hypothetical protein
MQEAPIFWRSITSRVVEIEKTLFTHSRTVEIIFKNLEYLHFLHMLIQIESRWMFAKFFVRSLSSLIWVTTIRTFEEIGSCIFSQDILVKSKYGCQINTSIWFCQFLIRLITLHERMETEISILGHPVHWREAWLVFLGSIMTIQEIFRQQLIKLLSGMSIWWVHFARAYVCAHVIIHHVLRLDV